MLTFSRGEGEPELVSSLRDENFVVDVVRERRRFDVGVFPQLRAIIDRHKPHVLWTHGAKTHFLVRLAGLNRERAWSAFHHGYTATSLACRLYDQLDRWSLRGADSVMTACRAFAGDLHERVGVKRERLSVHRSPIAPSTFTKNELSALALRRELDLPPDARVVLTVGRLSKEKGHADLIRAMVSVKALSDVETMLLIVGDGPERAHLESLCARLGVRDAVRFAGYRHDVAACYQTANIFALPSYSEGSPNVLLEAMDAGIPIVATAVGGVGEMISHGEHGLLVPAGDAREIAKAVAELLGNAELRIALTVAARRSLAAYAPDRYYAAVRAVFENIVR